MGAYLNAGACAMEVKVLCRCVHTGATRARWRGVRCMLGDDVRRGGDLRCCPRGHGLRSGKRVRAAG